MQGKEQGRAREMERRVPDARQLLGGSQVGGEPWQHPTQHNMPGTSLPSHMTTPCFLTPLRSPESLECEMATV